MAPLMVAIKWVDAAYCSGGPQAREDATGTTLMTLFTCGWLIAEHDDRYVVGTDWSPEVDTFRGIAVVPKSGIVDTMFFHVVEPEEEVTDGGSGTGPGGRPRHPAGSQEVPPGRVPDDAVPWWQNRQFSDEHGRISADLADGNTPDPRYGDEEVATEVDRGSTVPGAGTGW